MTKIRKLPRISANKLAEYLTANAIRRKKIVYDAKYPSAFITTRYKDARDIIKGLIAKDHTISDISNFIADLKAKATSTDFQENDRTLSIAALEHLLSTDLTIFDDCDLRINENYDDTVTLQGVEISVFPDLFLTKTVSGKKHSGAVKIHISKENALSEEGQNIVGVLLYMYAESFLSAKGLIPNTKLCFSLDVFNEKLHCCPVSYKARLNRIEAACEEIALWWDKL